MHRNRSMDYSWYTRTGMGFGGALFLLGVLGHVAVPMIFDSLPAWELTLFTGLEAGGILVALLTPFVFAVALPLIE